jgi:hypothetical protein
MWKYQQAIPGISQGENSNEYRKFPVGKMD